MKNLLKNLLFIFISTLVTIGLLEIGIRIFVSKDRWQFRDATSDFTADDTLGWTQKRNYEIADYDMGTNPIIFKTNEDGLRPEWITPARKDSNIYRVLLVGNSTVASRMVPANQTIHYYLDSLLEKKGVRYEVINAAVQAYSTDQAYLNMKRLLPKYKPDMVLYGFCDNDVPGNKGSVAYGFYKPYFELTSDSQLVYHPLEKQNTQFTNYASGSVIKDVLRHSALWRFIRPYIINIRNKFTSDEGIRLEGGGNGTEYFDANIEKIDFKLFERLVVEMDKYCKQNNTDFAVYAHPTLQSVWLPQQKFVMERNKGSKFNAYAVEDKVRSICEKNDISFIPFVSYFLKNEDRGPFHLLPGDTHCNGTGYLLQAECISDFIVKSKIKS